MIIFAPPVIYCIKCDEAQTVEPHFKSFKAGRNYFKGDMFFFFFLSGVSGENQSDIKKDNVMVRLQQG